MASPNSQDFHQVATILQRRGLKLSTDRPSNREGSGRPWGAPGCPFLFLMRFLLTPVLVGTLVHLNHSTLDDRDVFAYGLDLRLQFLSQCISV